MNRKKTMINLIILFRKDLMKINHSIDRIIINNLFFQKKSTIYQKVFIKYLILFIFCPKSLARFCGAPVFACYRC